MGQIADALIDEEMFGTWRDVRVRKTNYRSGVKKYLNSVGVDYQHHYGLLLEFSRDVLKMNVTPNTSKDTLSLYASQDFKKFKEWLRVKSKKHIPPTHIFNSHERIGTFCERCRQVMCRCNYTESSFTNNY